MGQERIREQPEEREKGAMIEFCKYALYSIFFLIFYFFHLSVFVVIIVDILVNNDDFFLRALVL